MTRGGMRVSLLLRRTSRKGPGSWSDPTLLHSRHRLTEGSPRPLGDTPTQRPSSRPGGTVSRKGVSRRATDSVTNSAAAAAAAAAEPAASTSRGSAALYDGADNAYQYSSARGVGRGYGDTDHPSRYSWKADPAANKLPPNIVYTEGSMHGGGHGSAPRPPKRVEGATPPIEEVLSGTGSGKQKGSANVNWLGGERGKPIPDTLERATMEHAFGAGDFSMVDRQKLTFTRALRLMADATFKPRDADSRAFGGDGATKLSEQREELKTMDQRVVPYQHEHLMNDYLKNIDRLHTPSGAICDRDVLKGRYAGLLFFTESERSLAFMRLLQQFHKRHSPDFVVVGVSLAGKEMMDVTRAFGFFHCTHRDGATWVTRDSGLMVRPFSPMPRLVVVDGSTGSSITRGGVTAVVANPTTCFQAWRRGEPGFGFRDYLQSMYL